MRSASPRRAAALLVAAAAVVLVAACGSSNNSSSNNDSSGKNNGRGGNNEALTAYVNCLKQNGVTITLPSGGPRNGGGNGASRGPGNFPSGRPSNFPRPSGSAGMGNGGGFPGGGGGFLQKPDNVDQATWDKAQSACASLRPSMGAGRGNRRGGQNAAYENCLKQNGVTDTSKLDSSNATTKAAMEKCKVLRTEPSASASPTA